MRTANSGRIHRNAEANGNPEYTFRYLNSHRRIIGWKKLHCENDAAALQAAVGDMDSECNFVEVVGAGDRPVWRGSQTMALLETGAV